METKINTGKIIKIPQMFVVPFAYWKAMHKNNFYEIGHSNTTINYQEGSLIMILYSSVSIPGVLEPSRVPI